VCVCVYIYCLRIDIDLVLMQAYIVELYQDTLIDLLLPKNAKRLRLEIKKDLKVSVVIQYPCDLYSYEKYYKSVILLNG
jgi:hypothetical protein